MCVVASAKFARYDKWTSTRRTDYQLSVGLYDVPETLAKEPGKCLGCVTCPFSYESAEQQRKPRDASNLLEELRRRVKPHHREILSNKIETFLNPAVAELLAALNREFPLLYNLVTKRPELALESLTDHPDLWDGVDHHIQVVALQDGILNESFTLEVLKGLVQTAKSVSVRIDPLIPGYTDTDVVSVIIEDAASAGVQWISVGVYHAHKGQIDRLPGDTRDTRNSYVGEPTKMRPLAPIGTYEAQQVAVLREKCKVNGLTLGVWSLRDDLKHDAEDHDGCPLPTAAEIRRRYEDVERRKLEAQATARNRRRELKAVQEPYEWEAD